MFYEINNEMTEIDVRDINSEVLTIGIVKNDELAELGKSLGLEEDTIAACQKEDPMFRSGVDVRDEYTGTGIRILNKDGHEDFVALIIKKNLLIIVDIVDEDGSTINSFRNVIKKCKNRKVSPEKIIGLFIESLVADGNVVAEELRGKLTDMEETIVNNEAGKEFNGELLTVKRRILKYYNYYCQMLDIAEILEENENEVLDEDNLVYIVSLNNKVSRLKDDITALSSMADHIQDAYATLLDQKMNSTMKVFTIITTIFFPLTIIVGWYGMNFQNMPELGWQYGYLYVGVLSVLTVLILIIIGKIKKWF